MFDPYGKVTVLAPDGTTTRTASLYGNPFTFTGRRLDQETGLMQFRNRMYETGLGRFCQRDPERYIDSLSLYAVTQIPSNFLDPMGLHLVQGTTLFTDGFGKGLVYTQLAWSTDPSEEDGTLGRSTGLGTTYIYGSMRGKFRPRYGVTLDGCCCTYGIWKIEYDWDVTIPALGLPVHLNRDVQRALMKEAGLKTPPGMITLAIQNAIRAHEMRHVAEFIQALNWGWNTYGDKSHTINLCLTKNPFSFAALWIYGREDRCWSAAKAHAESVASAIDAKWAAITKGWHSSQPF